MPRGSKFQTIEKLAETIREHHERGHQVVLANGCFDLLHVGHTRYLQGAKALGDVLVLALNDDQSVSALKGKGRPLQSVEERAELLGALECVDYLVVFDRLTVDEILFKLRPDIHAKGTDYTTENVPERGTVQSYGGKVAIVGDPKNHSTIDLIQTVLTRFGH